jgi:hypothetical protein
MTFAASTSRQPVSHSAPLPRHASQPRCAGAQGTAKRRGATVTDFAAIAAVFVVFLFGFVEMDRQLKATRPPANAARQRRRAEESESQSTVALKATMKNVLRTQGLSAETITVKVNEGAGEKEEEFTVPLPVPESWVSWIPGARDLLPGLLGLDTRRRK